MGSPRDKPWAGRVHPSPNPTPAMSVSKGRGSPPKEN